MLYEGSLELIEAASALKLPTAIATNDTRIAAAAERLVQAPMFLLQLSIDGPDAVTHNQARPGVGEPTTSPTFRPPWPRWVRPSGLTAAPCPWWPR